MLTKLLMKLTLRLEMGSVPADIVVGINRVRKYLGVITSCTQVNCCLGGVVPRALLVSTNAVLYKLFLVQFLSTSLFSMYYMGTMCIPCCSSTFSLLEPHQIAIIGKKRATKRSDLVYSNRIKCVQLKTENHQARAKKCDWFLSKMMQLIQENGSLTVILIHKLKKSIAVLDQQYHFFILDQQYH